MPTGTPPYPRRPAALLRSRTDTRQAEPRESVGRPPADQRALRISNAPVNTPVPAESQTRGPPHATGTPLISRTSPAGPISFQGDTALHVKPSPGKSVFRPLFAPSVPQPPRSGRRLPFPLAVDRRSDAAVCQSGAFTKTTTVHLRGKRPTICSDPAPSPASSASGTRRRPVRKRCKPASRGKGRTAVQPQLLLRR